MLQQTEPEIFLSGTVMTVEDRPAGQRRFGEREAGRAIADWKFGPDADSSVAVFSAFCPRWEVRVWVWACLWSALKQRRTGFRCKMRLSYGKRGLVVSQAEGVGCRIDNVDLKNASSGSEANTCISALLDMENLTHH
jgi:hypothetical protein